MCGDISARIEMPLGRKVLSAFFPVATAALAIGMFVVDIFTPPTVALGALYVVVVLMSTRFCRTRGVMLVAAGCVAFTVVATFLGSVTVISSFCNVTAIVVATLLAVQSQGAQATLREQAGVLRAVFETTPDSISIVGGDYRYQRVNPCHERRWGIPAERTVGMHVSEVVGTEVFQQSVKPNLDRCFEGEEITYEAWFATPCGQLYLLTSASPLREDAGQVETALLVGRDMTEQMRASEALRAAQAELAHVNRVTTMGQMTASIAHELAQPISAVITNANAGLRWLKAEPPDLEEVRQTFGRIVRDGHRANEILSRIRALVKKAPPRRDQSELNEAIREVIALTQAECQRNGVRMRTRLADGLPSIEADRVQVQQVLLNLIVNAIEAMGGTSSRPRELIVASGEDDASEVFVEVQDTGPGFEPGEPDRLFQPFYTTKADGLGMGLAICRSIIEVHGGRLWAAPNNPHGAVFRFTLPTATEASKNREPLVS